MAQALEKVKKDLGPRAVILHTRTVRKGGVMGVGARNVVEITASPDARPLPRQDRRGIMPPTEARPSRAESPNVTAYVRIPGPQEHRARNPADEKPSVAEGAAVTSVPAISPASIEEISASTAALHGELAELRAMVRQLLSRPGIPVPETPGGAVDPFPVPAELSDYYARLLQGAVAEELARQIVADVRRRLAERPAPTQVQADHGRRRGPDGRFLPEPKAHGRAEAFLNQAVCECIERLLPPAEPLELNGGLKVVALVGPTGVGKTTTIAKLAAHFKLRAGKRVGLITADTYRIAAVDQLKAYAEILDLPLEVVLTPGEMAAAVRRLGDLDLVLIDTSGRSQKDHVRLQELRAFLDAAREAVAGRGTMEAHLVLSCTAHPRQLGEVRDRFASLGAAKVVFTKLDEAVGVGVVLNLARQLGMHLSYLTTGQDVPDDIEVGHGRRIAELILAGAKAAPERPEPDAPPPRLLDARA